VVERFLNSTIAANFTSELASKYRKRLERHGQKMFTFMKHDGVPWNNNNAEHAIKRFVKYRRENDGRYTEKTIKTYLVLASVFETCEFNNLNVIRFLLSKEQSLKSLVRMGGRNDHCTYSSYQNWSLSAVEHSRLRHWCPTNPNPSRRITANPTT